MRFVTSAAVGTCVLAILITTGVGADTGPEGATATGRIGVKVDIPSALFVNGEEVATLEPRKRLWLELEAGMAAIEVRAQEVAEISASEEVEIGEGTSTRLNYRLKRVLAEYTLLQERSAFFEPVGDLSLRDHWTGVQWTRSASGQDLSWHEAIAYCEGLTLDGLSDWRLPTIKELKEIVHPSADTVAKILPQFDVPQEEDARVWSADEAAAIITPLAHRGPRMPIGIGGRGVPAPPPVLPDRAVTVPGVRAAVLDLATGKALPDYKETRERRRALCVRDLEEPPDDRSEW
jgi:hypothetical protein